MITSFLKASRRAIPNTPPNSPPSSDLSSIPSDEEADSDLLANQTLAPPKEGNHISSTEWTPIATSNTSRTRTRKKTKASSKVEPVRFPEWTPETSTYLSKKPKPKRKPSTRKNEATTARSKKEKAPRQTPRQNSPEMDVTSLLNNGSATNSNEEPNLEENHLEERQSERSRLSERTTIRTTPDPETDLLDYSEAMTQDTSLVPQQRSDFASLSSSLPPINATGTRIPAEGAPPSDFGVSPALINSRATSLALETMSNRSTPVPRPVERLNFAVPTNTATGLQIQSPTPRQLNQTLIPAMDPSQAPDGQEAIIVDNEQLETIINLFNDQWLMFVQAREHHNVPMMRFALQQAVGSQEVIRNLAGGEEMLRICENWIAREELADLERAERDNPTPQVQRLAITQRAHSNTISPSPAPLPLTRQTSEITYLGRGQQPVQDQPPTQRPQTAQSHHSVRGNHLPPPPPPSTQPPPASAYYNQHRQVQHHPYYRQDGSQHQQQYPQQFVPNYDAHQQAQVAQTREPQRRQFHPHQQGNWRGYGRNWRTPRDPTTRLLEVGDYLMRAERIAGRVFRVRGRGRGRNQAQRQGNQHQEPRQ
ncbi:hypothetical protein PGT21_000721 [Puccinia graminis f. sp. tritici]|uniref:Uncharacterized protein n=1 Tax=Puccinia graminis f. sp. tritici TaxID=56615 RepID=A0A5B0P2A9_PUCGR|nr:hypothetical protein PGT21_000733 [Puccinia graminis f. sp. tritici]KAA1088569.1 hypothetical protein PGT21_000536 [Puccinia graminis f. sp. tritici]KAA1090295.1 hypothetical protein PGTUg99_003173 [Puccinia graminis f. sp. tritici]KAA1095541.1 hypothetical protein PGT21_000721 [Puccinia graminis f. sp. tritici]KAA1136889.1 hypothetical protein PGTUg99_001029 [Puccinia graminis f. sp. tritici]